MNITFSEFSRFPRHDDCVEYVYDKITANTTTDEFDKFHDECQLPESRFNLYYYGSLFEGDYKNTPFAVAALHGNIPLINHIFSLAEKNLQEATLLGHSTNNLGGKHLLSLGLAGITPLHSAILCENLEKGYLAAKRLVQLGTPVNIIESPEDGVYLGHTPLEEALFKGKIKIAALLLRIGGIARPFPEIQDAFEAAKKEIMTPQEKLFKLGAHHNDVFPDDVINYILSISSKLI